ncbi:RsiV family protein [Niastella vici]|uniref:RsiV family protein n=1 Tax=Niastella vici TaxID=1703345 RepID=UPI00373FC6B7
MHFCLPNCSLCTKWHVYHLKNEEKISEHIFTETIPISDNFLLTSKGIGFSYLPNELGAYALGEVFLYIPFKELDTYLKPEFKQLIGIMGQ